MGGRPHVRFDWTHRGLMDMARWANRRIWRYSSFEDYRGAVKSKPVDPDQMGMLDASA